jgi:hypothetical protein
MWNIPPTRLKPWFLRFLSLCVCQHPDIVNIFAVVGSRFGSDPTTIYRLTDCRRSVIIPHILSEMAVMVETAHLLFDVEYA